MRNRITLLSAVFAAFVLGAWLAREPRPVDIQDMPTQLRATGAYLSMQWYNQQRAQPTNSIPLDWRDKGLDHIAKMALRKSVGSHSGLSWIPVGPDNIGGRVRSLAIDPTNPDIIYCGSVSGGVFKTTNGGSSWFPITDFAQNMVIGALVIHPNNPNILYAGTGEGYFNFDALRGIGVLKSTDGGGTWSVLNNFTGAPAPYYFYYITKLVIRADRPETLYAATVGGVWRTTNGGSSWTRLSVGSRSTYCMDLLADPTNYDVMYASFGLFSSDGVYKTTNGGTNWNRLSVGFPSSGFGRTSLALSPTNPSVLYACLSDTVLYSTHSIRKSTDGGATWAQVGTPWDNDPNVNGGHLGGQGWFNNVIAVHPTNASTVYTGGINNFRSTDAGSSWNRISNGYGSPFVHVDQHVITFHPTDPNTLFIGNDGGVYKSTNGGSSFTSLNNSLPITQFYSGAVHPTQDVFYGGTQDNGTLKSGTLPFWNMVLGGDGGYTAVDYLNPNNVYTEYVYLSFYKSTNGGALFGWSSAMNGIPIANGGTSDRCNFIAPFVMDPSNPQVLVAGTFRVFRTSNAGAQWHSISGDLTGQGSGLNQPGQQGATITALAIARSNGQVIYAGTSGYGVSFPAKIQVTTNLGSSWADVTRVNLPNREVRAFAIAPWNANHAVAVFSGYNVNTPSQPGHVFQSTNRGTNWTDISGNLPDIPVNAVVLDSADLNHIAVGTDLGIFETFDDGSSWTPQNSGLANVSVADLDLRMDGYLFAATHGRGMFRSTQPFRASTAPTTLAIVIHQNTVLPRYLDLYVVATDSFTTPPALSLTISGGSPETVAIAQQSYRMYHGDRVLSSVGTYGLTATATDTSGSLISVSRSLVTQLLKQGVGGEIASEEGDIRALFLPAGVGEDMYVTLIPEEISRWKEAFVVDPVTFGPLRNFGGEVLLSFSYANKPVEANQIGNLAIVRWDGTSWQPVATGIDEDARLVTASVRSLGTYALMVSKPGSEVVPGGYQLFQNYPNPFNPITTIRYTVSSPLSVRIVVFNTLGQEIATLIDDAVTAGDHEVHWDGRDRTGSLVASGVYLYRLEGRVGTIVRFSDSRKMVFVK